MRAGQLTIDIKIKKNKNRYMIWYRKEVDQVKGLPLTFKLLDNNPCNNHLSSRVLSKILLNLERIIADQGKCPNLPTCTPSQRTQTLKISNISKTIKLSMV